MKTNTYLPPSPGSLIQLSRTDHRVGYKIPTSIIVQQPSYYKLKEDTSTAHARALLIREIQEAGSIDVFVMITRYEGSCSRISKFPCKLFYEDEELYIKYKHEHEGELEALVHKVKVNADGNIRVGYRFEICQENRHSIAAEMLSWSRNQGMEKSYV